MGHYQLKTTRGYALLDVASALQKGIRRGDALMSGYWAIELFESGYQDYLWRRLLTVSAEDCWGIITQEIEALYRAWLVIAANKGKTKGRIFASKAVIILCLAKKSRDPDHLQNLVYDAEGIPPEQLLADLESSRDESHLIPDYAYDIHTSAGRKAGKTKTDFFREEHAALSPRVQGLFDWTIENLES